MVHIPSAGRLIALLVIQVLLVRKKPMVQRDVNQAITVRRTHRYVALVKQAISALIQQVYLIDLQGAWK